MTHYNFFLAILWLYPLAMIAFLFLVLGTSKSALKKAAVISFILHGLILTTMTVYWFTGLRHEFTDPWSQKPLIGVAK